MAQPAESMTTYQVHPLVESGVIKGAKIPENWPSAESRLIELQKNIASALPFENQASVHYKLPETAFYMDGPNLKPKDGLYDSLTWTVVEVEQVMVAPFGWQDYPSVFGLEKAGYSPKNPKHEYRTVLRLVEEKDVYDESLAKLDSYFETVSPDELKRDVETIDKMKEPAQPEAPKDVIKHNDKLIHDREALIAELWSLWEVVERMHIIGYKISPNYERLKKEVEKNTESEKPPLKVVGGVTPDARQSANTDSFPTESQSRLFAEVIMHYERGEHEQIQRKFVLKRK